MYLKRLAKRTLATLAMSMLCLVALAQDRTVTGTVIDGTGEPVIGANVLEVGTTNGAITDLDGNFTVTGLSATSQLQISFIGYLTETITVGNQTTINVTLKDDSQALEEVVVIGYGTVKRRDLTGSVASVSGDKLAANPVANVAQALQGQLPGVTVTAQDGRPGASMQIRVRGGGSITQSNDPLFIVDGVQVSGIDDIPADNIESIDVLKDAASTAIYGARGANGVILVTTKGGKEGKATVRYNMYYQLKSEPETLEVMDGYDYVYHTWAYSTAYGESYGDNVAKYFGLGTKYGNNLNNYKNVKSHNYVKDILQSAGSWNHDLSISGGSEKTKYYASVNYMNDEGNRINTSFNRWNANVKLTQKINKNLTFDADIRYSETSYQGTKWDIATSAYKYRPIDNPLGDADYTTAMGNGSANVELEFNPLAIINNYENIVKRQRLQAKTGLKWEIIKGLRAQTELSLNRNWSETKNWDAGLENGYNTAKLTNSNGYGVHWTNTINYEVQGLGENHSLSFLVGNEIMASKSNKSWIYGSGYPDEFGMNDAFGMINMSNPSLGKDQVGASIGTPSTTTSFFGRANYSWKGRYLLTATMRADGSSKFAPNNRWGYFPAAAAAWRISDEAFMEGAQDWLDNLKLRLSYGTSGADNIDASLWKETWKTQSITVDGQTITTYVPGDMMPNYDLMWETTTSRNIGLDYGFFNSRIRGSIDFYWNSTDDNLMVVPVNPASGYTYQMQNVAKTSNKGIEFALGADIVRSDDFNLAVNFSYNFNKNKVDEIAESANSDTHTGWGSSMRIPYYDYIIREGQPVGLIQGFKSNGWYTVDDFNYSNGVWTLKSGIPDTQDIVNYAGGGNFQLADGQNAFPGMIKYEDVNKDGVINGDDATIIGKTMPQHTGGITFNGNWKNLDFTLGFTYQLGGDIYNANAMHTMMGNKDNDLGANRLAILADCFKIYDVDASGNLVAATTPEALAALNANAKYALPYSEYGLVSSEFVENATYLRLQNLTVGYTLPKEWTKKAGIQNLRVYFTGSNLFCLNSYSGLDPEVNTNMNAGGDSFPTPNYDYNAYPRSRSYTFGVNVSF